MSEEQARWRGPETPNWSPVTFDLSGAAGEEVEIELATEMTGEPRAGPPGSWASAYAVWLNPTLIAPAARPRPSIVLILVDALRADHLGCYGYQRPTSPFLDRLAASGVLFEDANSQGTWTLPSALSLLTSSYRFTRGGQVGVRPPGTGGDIDSARLLSPAAMPTSLQGELRRAGYTTLSCVGGGFLSPALGFDSGFDWCWSPEHAPMLPDQLAVLKRRLAEDPQTPFFLFLHTYEVHNYFQSWAHCLEQFDHNYLGPLTDPRRLADAVLHETPDELSAADLQYVRDVYDGEILHTDRYLRLFLDWLLEQPWGGNTIVVVTADHGESLGEHGGMTHGGVPYREVARVPLLLRLPGGRWRGRRIAEPVASVDLMPTVLELAGMNPPAGLVGESLLPLLQGGGKTTARPIFCESRGTSMLVRQGRWSYVSSRGEKQEELYDLARDPRQSQNLAASSPEQVHHMRRLLAEVAMRGARGYRLVAAGPRAEKMTLGLDCDGPLSYLDVPTLQQGDKLSVVEAGKGASSASSRGDRAQITLSPGKDPQVILFERAEADSTVLISATLGDKPMEAARFHLGSDQRSPDRTPVSIGLAATPLLSADYPPLAGPSRMARPGAATAVGWADLATWGIWIWLPSTVEPALPPAEIGQELPSALREDLRSLGYLR